MPRSTKSKWRLGAILLAVALIGAGLVDHYVKLRAPFRFIPVSRTDSKPYHWIRRDAAGKVIFRRSLYRDFYVFRGDLDTTRESAERELVPLGYTQGKDSSGAWIFLNGRVVLRHVEIQRLAEISADKDSTDLKRPDPSAWIVVTIHRNPHLSDRIAAWLDPQLRPIP